MLLLIRRGVGNFPLQIQPFVFHQIPHQLLSEIVFFPHASRGYNEKGCLEKPHFGNLNVINVIENLKKLKSKLILPIFLLSSSIMKLTSELCNMKSLGIIS